MKGFTLPELLVAMLIAGILAAIAIPSYLNRIKAARYSEAKTLMRAIATEAQIFRAENERYPEDVSRNVRPEGVSSSPVVPGDETPFGAAFDWDSYQVGEFCWMQVVFLGQDGERQASQTEFQGVVGAIATVGDDRILVVAAGECNRI